MVFLGVIKTLVEAHVDFLAVIITPLVTLTENHKQSLAKVTTSCMAHLLLLYTMLV